jgi:general secretion pathway protein B
MSILLDALKRSESQRELGSVPTLQTSTETSTPATQPAPAWLPFGLVLIAAGLMTWLGLEQFSFEEVPLSGGLAQQQNASADSVEPAAPAQSTPEQAPAAGKSILPRLADSDSTQPATEQPQAAEPRAGRQVRDYAAERSAASATPSEPTRDNAVRQAEVAKVEIEAPTATAPMPADTAAGDNYEPEIINYWQVPEKMRDGLPDLRISVLVYAETPENRFVLMNGERLREGEELPNGLLLEEIQRDRAIFNYRNYRFYLKS